MANPYDTVISIGGQSFVDGIWRLLGPALEGLTNPLPLALPGFTNATMRITQILPIIPSTPVPGALTVVAEVEVAAEALLCVTGMTQSIPLDLAQRDFSLTDIAGNLALPGQTGTLSNITFTGGTVNLGSGAGQLVLPPASGAISGGSGAGTIAPGSLELSGIPLPLLASVPLDLTPSRPIAHRAFLRLAAFGPNAQTFHSLAFIVGDTAVAPGTLDPALPATVKDALQSAVTDLATRLKLPLPLQPDITDAMVESLLAPVQAKVAEGLKEALLLLCAETGRLLFPAWGPGAACDAKMLPELAEARLSPATSGGYSLQIAFRRSTSLDTADFPTFSAGTLDCNVRVGNDFLLQLICCLVRRLPAFSLPLSAFKADDNKDVQGNTHLACYNFTRVTASFGGAAIGGGAEDGLSVCMDAWDDGQKRFSLVGKFHQGVDSFWDLPSIAHVDVSFRLPFTFDLNDVASIANLKPSGNLSVSASVSPGIAFAGLLILIAAVAAGIGGWIAGAVAAVLGPIAVIIVLLLLGFGCAAASYLLRNAARTLLSGAALVSSPAAVPPGLFEAFGRLSPVKVRIDDLSADGVLHTPVSPWALLPRLQFPRTKPPRPKRGTEAKAPRARAGRGGREKG